MRSPRKGLTLVEVLVTLAIFVILAGFMFMAVREVVEQWKLSERRRTLYEKAPRIVESITDDLALMLTREAPGVTDVKMKFIVDYDPDSPDADRQRIFFVRSFEGGNERAIVGNAGDGRPNSDAFKAPDADAPDNDPPANGIDADSYTGLKVGDFKALGGMAMVSYFVKDQTLYRAIKAPVEGPFSVLADPSKAQLIAPDVLYLRFEMWSQATKDWEKPEGEKDKNAGAQHIWDSTRGITAAPLNRFFLHRGDGGNDTSLNDPEDDVFPRKIRVTIVVDSPMPRCLYTKLTDNIGDGDSDIPVEEVKGFADGGDEDSYILIDEEWIRYSKKDENGFHDVERGVRGTRPREHKRDAIVRTGKVFQRIVFIPNWREDFTSDEVYFQRKVRKTGPKTILAK